MNVDQIDGSMDRSMDPEDCGIDHVLLPCRCVRFGFQVYTKELKYNTRHDLIIGIFSSKLDRRLIERRDKTLFKPQTEVNELKTPLFFFPCRRRHCVPFHFKDQSGSIKICANLRVWGSPKEPLLSR